MFQQGTSTIAMPSADEGEVNIFFLIRMNTLSSKVWRSV